MKILQWATMLCLIAGGVTAQGSTTEFRAGAATSNATPPLGLPIIGGWNSPPGEAVHDEIQIRCLVLDDGETRIAFAIVDNVGIPRDVCAAAKRKAEEQTGIPAAQVMVSSTHTHSSVSARGDHGLAGGAPFDAYQEFLVARIADGVQRAVANLAPAQVGWGSANAPEHVFNRRWHMKPGPELRNPFGGTDQVRMNPPRGHADLIRPAGPTDPEVDFVSVRDVHGKPVALLANYSLHYVGGVPQGVYSADYFAVFAQEIGRLFKSTDAHPPFVGILTNGTSGDINNIDFTDKSPPRRGPFEQMNAVAKDVARKVFDAERDTEYHAHAVLAAAEQTLDIAVRRPTPAQLAYANEMTAKPADAETWQRHERVYAQRVSRLADAPEKISVALQCFRIGDLAVCAIPFEVFVEIGLELKARSPFPATFTVSLANGSFGYLPTAAQHELGGYETWMGTNNVETGASAKMVDQLLSMLREMK